MEFLRTAPPEMTELAGNSAAPIDPGEFGRLQAD
jgi:hypothetical protein